MTAASYFVYYKVRTSKTDELRRLIGQLFAAVERETGVRGRWMRRRDDPSTYMEIYENVSQAELFEPMLEREVSRLGIASCLSADAERRTEIFISAPVGGN